MRHRYVVAVLKSEDSFVRLPMPSLKSAETLVSSMSQPAVILVEEVEE